MPRRAEAVAEVAAKHGEAAAQTVGAAWDMLESQDALFKLADKWVPAAEMQSLEDAQVMCIEKLMTLLAISLGMEKAELGEVFARFT